MSIHCTVDAEKDVSMKKLKSEEAITILKDMKVDIPVPKAAVTQIKRNAAIEMAIDAMKAQDAAGDTINRKAAIEAIKQHVEVENDYTDIYHDGYCDGIYDAIDALEGLPSAQPDLPIKEKCAFCPHCKNCDVNDDLSIQPCVDTISRQAVIEINRSYHGQMPNEVNHRIWKEINELPSAQPEIIRCKDCKHHHYEGEDIPYCDRIDYGYGWKDNDYCSMAERRTDERFDINTRSSC